ncbi:hypothetical protein O0L34_g16105 [Tuta absoluta]|nr:hypothetical protein O0L34_g16105 [Tuta absoluta]
MASDNRQPFGQCRCCLDFGYHKDISQPYFRNGVRQVYRETFLESFNLHLSTNKYLSNMICKSCIRKLNNASDFKALVVETERQLLSRIQCTSDLVTVSQHKTSFVEEEVKDAVIKKEEDDDWNNDGDEINPQDDIEEWAVSDGPSTSSQTLIKNLAPCFVKLEQLNEAQDKVKLNANVIERKNDSQAGDKLNVTSRADMKHIADVVEETCSLIHNITKKLKTIETKCPNKKINRNTGLSAVGFKATTIKTAHKNKPSAAVNNKPRPDKGDNVIAAKNEKTDTASESNKDNTRKNQAPQMSLKPSFND